MVLSEVLEHEANLGYELFHRQHLLKFNGATVQNLAQLAQLVDACKTGEMVFEFDRCVFVGCVSFGRGYRVGLCGCDVSELP